MVRACFGYERDDYYFLAVAFSFGLGLLSSLPLALTLLNAASNFSSDAFNLAMRFFLPSVFPIVSQLFDRLQSFFGVDFFVFSLL